MTDKNVSIMNIGSMGYLPQVFKKIENEKSLILFIWVAR